MALHEVMTQQGDTVWSDGHQVVIGEADPEVVTRPVWGGQSPGAAWREYAVVSLINDDAETSR
jgi:hypothetical protein